MAAGMKCGLCGAPRAARSEACGYCGAAFPDAIPSAPSAVGGVPPGVLEAIDAGNLITAIKHYRDHTRCSLKEAKEACEAIAERRGRR